MRLAFWRAGKDKAGRAKALVEKAVLEKAVVQKAVAKPAPNSYSPAATHPTGDLDLRALGQALARKKRWIIIPTLLAAVLSVTAVNLVTPRYKSEARILVDGRENVFLRPNGERNEERGLDGRRRGGHQPGAVAAVARPGARDHQEEQARRAPGIRSGAAGAFAVQIAAGPVRDRP